MMHNLTLRSSDLLTREQLAMFNALSDQVRLTEDDRRRALDLDERAWTAWVGFLADGPLPALPPVPEMLRRLGETAFNLSVMAERDLAPQAADFPAWV
jgi:hypothetical protein